MVKSPEVSVIIPVYNQAQFIDKSIKSVLKQSYQDFEIIVINDGSTDNTEAIVKGFIDFRILYICHKNNSGVSEARNTGIRLSRGKDMQVKLLRNEPFDVGVVCAWSFNMDKNGDYISKRNLPRKEGYIFEDLLSTNPISVPTVLIRKECFKKIGLFDSSLDGQEDWDMWIRVAKYYKFSLIKIPLAKRRIHPNRISYNSEKKVITAKRIIKKHINELKIRRNINSKHY